MGPLRTALDRIVAFLPNFVAGLLVFLAGWLIAALVARAVRALLPKTGFDRFLARHKLVGGQLSEHSGTRTVAAVSFWVVFLIGLMQAANIWGLQFVSQGLARAIAYVPNLVSALVIFAVSYVLANWVGDRLRASARTESEYGSARLILPSAVRAGILTLGAFMALRQLLIATEILVLAFGLVFGAIALATALAFGLGGRRTVERMTQDWYDDRRARRAFSRETSSIPTARPTTAPPAGPSEEPPGLH